MASCKNSSSSYSSMNAFKYFTAVSVTFSRSTKWNVFSSVNSTSMNCFELNVTVLHSLTMLFHPVTFSLLIALTRSSDSANVFYAALSLSPNFAIRSLRQLDFAMCKSRLISFIRVSISSSFSATSWLSGIFYAFVSSETSSPSRAFCRLLSVF